MNRERWQQLLAAALALAVWQGAAMLVHAPILLPSPLRVADRLGALLVTLDFGGSHISHVRLTPESCR